jgi:hypothetical protein
MFNLFKFRYNYIILRFIIKLLPAKTESNIFQYYHNTFDKLRAACHQ